MAAKPQDPLDALQLLLNEALVQTGKALRASRRDAQGNFTQPQSLNNSKIPDTIRAFHTALDDLESNIVQAKSVMQRDLNQVRANKPQQQQQQQTDPAPKQEIASPMVVQMTSPPQPPAVNGTAGMASLADLSTGATTNGDAALKAEGDSSGAAGSGAATVTQTSTKEEPKAEGASADQPQDASADASFTDMAFAPPDDQNQFDLNAFASTENMDEMLSLENLIPAATADKPDETKKEGETTGDAGNSTGAAATSTTSAPSAESNLANMFTDSGQTDGMDFDFSIGGGGEETFDDLMNTRDDTFEMMDNDFDAAFFGLDGENAS